MKILGIDPGKNGGFVILEQLAIQGCPEFCKSFKMPLTADEAINGRAIFEWLVGHKPYSSVYLEDVHSIFGVGAKSNFNFGKNVGLLQGVLQAAEIPFILVQPKVWQSRCHSKGYGKTSKAKKRSLDAARRLYPEFVKTITPEKTSRMRKTPEPHDGLVDALLIAYYGKTLWLQGSK